MNVQTKLRQAFGSMKDHASIGKALIYNHHSFANIEIAIVRATSHDNVAVDDKYMHEILFLVSNHPGCIQFLAHRLSHRLGKTRDRVVALKTLVLTHRLLRAGNRSFEQQLRSSHASGLLRLKTDRFPRNSDNLISLLHHYAAYLEERMNWFITQAGKLEASISQGLEFHVFERKPMDMILRRLTKCQVFLEKILDFSPSVVFPFDSLAYTALSNTLKESFQVYMTFWEEIAAVVNIFFDLERSEKALACDILKKATKQSQELVNFYENCKRVIGNKHLEYPLVQIITVDHVLALNQFVNCAPLNCLTKSTEMKTTMKSEEVENDQQRGENSLSSTLFSWTLETKISKVWVVFDEEEPDKYHVSPGRLFNDTTNDHLVFCVGSPEQ
ncbi:unnamed protein product [Ilex paraguariensis]|uniref:ENTH domain-containing protein n=1 Tax=Ilex paraguariensis TaxID=185542 RepID=A0ABC8R2U0_9AQUA